MDSKEAKFYLEQAFDRLLINRPFFYSVITRLNRKIVNDPRKCPTMGITLNDKLQIILKMNPSNLIKMMKEEMDITRKQDIIQGLCDILEHEIMHFTEGHLTCRKENSKGFPFMIVNVAMDYSINQIISWKCEELGNHLLDGNKKCLNQLKKDGVGTLEKKREFEYYLSKLDKPESQEGQGQGQGQEGECEGEQEGEGGTGNGQIDDHSGWDEIEESGKEESDEKQGSNGNENEEDDNDEKDGNEAINDIKDEVMEEARKKIIREAYEECASRGLSPGYGQEKYKEVNSNTLNWKTILKRYVRQYAGKKKLSFRRRDRRMRTFPGKKRKHKAEFNIVVDTSGSIGNETFGRFVNEIESICQAYSIEKFRLVEIDTEIKFDEEVTARDLNDVDIHGRGGTVMKPAFEMFKEEASKTPTILFTDGYTDRFPNDYRFQSLWVITPNGSTDVPENHDFRYVQMKEE